jgi:hypothetical protein
VARKFAGETQKIFIVQDRVGMPQTTLAKENYVLNTENRFIGADV